MSPPIVTLTTDFGEGSPYVAQMKAVALSINPDITLVDVTHSITPQDIAQGALVMADATAHFPSGTIHIGVIDPGVGTQRKIVYAKVGTQRFVAPDNGLLSLVALDLAPVELRFIESLSYLRKTVSATFHGRDIMAPAAAHLLLGLSPAALGPAAPELTRLDWPAVIRANGIITGNVVWRDQFGNLITDIRRNMLPADCHLDELDVTCGQCPHVPVVRTYAQAHAGTVIALFGSSDRLEIAVTNGSAARTLDCGPGEKVELRWPAG